MLLFDVTRLPKDYLRLHGWKISCASFSELSKIQIQTKTPKRTEKSKRQTLVFCGKICQKESFGRANTFWRKGQSADRLVGVWNIGAVRMVPAVESAVRNERVFANLRAPLLAPPVGEDGRAESLAHLSLLPVADVAHGSVLQQRGEHSHETRHQVYVNGFEIRDFRQSGICWRYEGRHGEYCGDTQGNSGRYGLATEPEGDPGEHDDECGGNVDLDDIVAQRAHEVELAGEARVVSCNGDRLHWWELGKLRLSCSCMRIINDCHVNTNAIGENFMEDDNRSKENNRPWGHRRGQAGRHRERERHVKRLTSSQLLRLGFEPVSANFKLRQLHIGSDADGLDRPVLPHIRDVFHWVPICMSEEVATFSHLLFSLLSDLSRTLFLGTQKSGQHWCWRCQSWIACGNCVRATQRHTELWYTENKINAILTKGLSAVPALLITSLSKFQSLSSSHTLPLCNRHFGN